MSKIMTFDVSNMPNDWFRVVKKYIKLSKYKIYIHNENNSLDDFTLNVVVPLFTNKIPDYVKIYGANVIKIHPDIQILKTLQTFDNKKLFEMFMAENFSDIVPKFIDPKNITTFPFLFKTATSNCGMGVHIVSNDECLKKLIKRTRDSYVLQEYIHADNNMVGQYLCESGNIIHQQHYITNIDRNDVVIIRGKLPRSKKVEYNNEKLNEVFKKVSYTGFACVDYAIVDNNNIKIFEINPRLGGTVMNDYNVFSTFMNKLGEFYRLLF